MPVKFNVIPKKPAKPFSEWDAKSFHGFRGNPKDRLFYGVELEFEVDADKIGYDSGCSNLEGAYCEKDRKAITALNRLNRTVGKYAIIKSDGSLDDGIEIATAPCSYSKQRNQWNRFFNQFSRNNLKSEKTCGMHVHVSRKRLTDQQIERLIEFVSTKSNKSFLEKIAGRQENNYCYYSCDHYKYNAVNNDPDYTIEFRLFSAPANKREFIYRLQLVKSLLNFCKSKKFAPNKNGFKEFLFRQGNFRELKNFIIYENL